MKAISFYDKGDIRYSEDFPEPQIKHPEDVKLKILFTGVCGSDLKEYTDGPIFFRPKGHIISGCKAPCVMGHEISAEVIETGSKVSNFKKGDKVVVEVTGTCHDLDRFPESSLSNSEQCVACAAGCYNACEHLGLTGLGFSNGGLAEYMVTTQKKLIKFDESKIPVDVAALVQPIAVSWHAVRVSKYKKGQSALILGGGPIGLTTIFALKGHGCTDIVVSEPAAIRRELAEKLGVKTYDPTGKTSAECITDLKALSPHGHGFHRSYDCSGFPITFETALKTLTFHGVSTNVAMWGNKKVDYEPMHVTFAEKYITGSICFLKIDFEETVAAFEAGLIPVDEVKSLISSKIDLKDGIEHGFMELLNNKANHIKILFHP